MAVRVTVNGASASSASVSVGGTPTVTTVTAASAIKIGALEDNVGNLDVGDGLETGETLVYNATTKKWQALSLADEVANAVSEQIGDSVSAAISGGNITFDGGDY